MAIWKYGPAQTCKTPDEAVAALQAAVDAGTVDNPFTEAQYIRGTDGAYGVPADAGAGAALVRSRSLQSSEQYPLVFDTEDDAVVRWYGRDYDLVTGHFCLNIESELKGLRFKNIRMESGIVAPWLVTAPGILDPGVPGSSVQLEDCAIGDVENPADTQIAAACVADNYFSISFIRTRAETRLHAITVYTGDSTGRIIAVVNSLLRNQEPDYPLLNLKSNFFILLLLVHSTFLSTGRVWKELTLSEDSFWMVGQFNNIFHSAAGPIFDLSNEPIVTRSALSSNNNLWYAADGGAVAKIGPVEYDLAALSARFGIERDSIYADPKLASDGRPQPGSPALLLAGYPGECDLHGTPRARGLDAGAVQVSYVRHGYSTPEDVIAYSGVTAADLQQDTETGLYALLNTWIMEVTQIINSHCGQSWTIGAEPSDISNACTRMVANIIGLAVQRRKSPVVQVGEFNVKLVQDQVMSNDVKELLEKHRKSGSPLLAVGSTLPDEEDT